MRSTCRKEWKEQSALGGCSSPANTRHAAVRLCRRLINPACCESNQGRAQRNALSILSYGQLFLKPLCNLHSISLSLKQGQGLPSIIHHCCNNHSCLFILRPNTPVFTRTFQTFLHNSLG